MIYPIVVFGDPVLKKKAANIKKDQMDIKELAANMFETMKAAHGIGLAAPQVGLPIRVFIVDGRPLEEEEMDGFVKVFINAEIVEESGEEWAFEEGCLSIPGIRENIQRKPVIKIKYLDENWVEHIEEYDGMKARIIQHEYDHIQGILFTDHLTSFKKRILKGKLTNISKGKCDAEYRIKAPLSGR
jgi:peptide deformylase